VLIWYFRGNQNARDFIKSVPYEDRSISSLCIMELIQGCLDRKEIKTIKEFIKENFSTVIHPDERISEKAILLLERHAMSDGLRTVDAIIAASASVKNTTFATANYKHFKNISNLNILKFEPSET
jgi:predicted nucleic acid-binding protein